MSRQLEQSEDLDDGDELEDVRLVVELLRHARFDDDVHVKAQRGYKVDHVHW